MSVSVTACGGTAEVRGTSSIVAAYASLSPSGGTFVDAMVGLGRLHFSTRRRVDAEDSSAAGERDGDFMLAAFSAGIEQRDERLLWALYGRGDWVDATLKGYRESGAGRYDLRFDPRKLRSITATLGARIEYTQELLIGSITPRVRAEWSRELAAAQGQGLDYADIAEDSLYRLQAAGWSREQISMVVGARLDLSMGWSVDLEAGVRAAAAERAMLLRLLLTLTF